MAGIPLLGKNTELIKLDCCNLKISSLNLRNNSRLRWLHCCNNGLNKLIIGNNSVLGNAYFREGNNIKEPEARWIEQITASNPPVGDDECPWFQCDALLWKND
jgi:hypothetical protein